MKRINPITEADLIRLQNSRPLGLSKRMIGAMADKEMFYLSRAMYTKAMNLYSGKWRNYFVKVKKFLNWCGPEKDSYYIQKKADYLLRELIKKIKTIREPLEWSGILYELISVSGNLLAQFADQEIGDTQKKILGIIGRKNLDSFNIPWISSSNSWKLCFYDVIPSLRHLLVRLTSRKKADEIFFMLLADYIEIVSKAPPGALEPAEHYGYTITKCLNCNRLLISRWDYCPECGEAQ